MNDSKHTFIGKMSKLESFDDFRKVLIKKHGSVWIKASESDIKKGFGVPKQYPCFVKIEKEYDSEADWGDGWSEYFHFYYV